MTASAEPTSLRVLMTATSYPRTLSDWRGVFIRHLVDALARTSVRLALWAPPGDTSPNVRRAMGSYEQAWLAQLADAGGISHVMRHPRLGTLITPIKLLWLLRACYGRERDIDVYHINWLQCALPLPRNSIPAVITVLGNDLKLLRLPLMRSALRRIMRHRRVAICPNAEWMVQPLRAAFGDVARVVPISFGIDPVWYAIKRNPTLTPRKWLVVVRLTRDKLGPLFEWSEALFSGPGRELHLFGPMQETVAVPPWVRYHGPATPADLAGTWFPQATGLISLSQHAEGRPQVMLEAMASGLPIVASPLPAHASIVEHDVTGALCESAESYAHAIRALDDPLRNAQAGDQARAKVQREIGSWDDCARRYLRVYADLLETPHD